MWTKVAPCRHQFDVNHEDQGTDEQRMPGPIETHL